MIYFVEDDLSIRELVIYTLKNTGINARGFSCAKEFWEGFNKEKPELILLDLMLPDYDGLSILKKVKSIDDRVLVMIISAKGTEYDKVIGLEIGADDYLPKPFGMMELIARIKNLIKRSGYKDKSEEYVLNKLYMNVVKHEVKCDGADIFLTYKEFELLHYLLRHNDIVLTRDQILSSVWGYEYEGETRTLDVHIRKLRWKLGECGNMIQTVRGIGYKIGVK